MKAQMRKGVHRGAGSARTRRDQAFAGERLVVVGRHPLTGEESAEVYTRR